MTFNCSNESKKSCLQATKWGREQGKALNRCRIVLSSVLNWGHARYLFKGSSEGLCVRVSDFVHHFINIFTRRFQTHFCSLYFYALNVFDHRIGGRLFESPFQISPAQ